MPAAFLLVADLGAVVAAFFALLIGVAAYLLLQSIGNVIGKIGIGPFSVNVGNWFKDLGDDVSNWCIGLAKGLWIHAATIFQATAFIFDRLFDATISAISHAMDYGDHIVTSIIPNETTKIEHYARGLVTGLGNEIDNDAAAAANAVASALGAADRAAYHAAYAASGTVTNAIESAVSSAADTSISYADGAVGQLRAYVDQQITAALATAKGEVDDLKSLLGGQLASLSTTVQSDFSAAEDYAKAQASGAITTAEAFATGAAQSATSALSNALSPVIQSTELVASQGLGLAQQAITTAGADLTTAENEANTAVSTAVGTLTGDVEGAFTDAANDILNGAAAVGGDLSGVGGLLAGAILSVTGALAARVAAIEECYVGECDSAPFNFQSLLNDALGVAEFAGVFAFLSQAISDPAGAEQSFAGGVQALFNTGQGMFDSLLSL